MRQLVSGVGATCPLESIAEDCSGSGVAPSQQKEQMVSQVIDLCGETSPSKDVYIDCTESGVAPSEQIDHLDLDTGLGVAPSQQKEQMVSQVIDLSGETSPSKDVYTDCTELGVAPSEQIEHVDLNTGLGVATQLHEAAIRDTTVTAMLEAESTASAADLNPEAVSFTCRDPALLHKGRLAPDLSEDWEQVQRVHHGGVGDEGVGLISRWQTSSEIESSYTRKSSRQHEQSRLVDALPFKNMDDIHSLLSTAPKHILKVGGYKIYK